MATHCDINHGETCTSKASRYFLVVIIHGHLAMESMSLTKERCCERPANSASDDYERFNINFSFPSSLSSVVRRFESHETTTNHRLS